jgi:tetratricopeptide (TPR) repeat protein
MKKLLLLVAIIGFIQVLHAQDFTKVRNLVLLPNQLEGAKTEIDKLMTDPKAQAKAEGWLWKAKVYAGLYADDKLRAKYPGSEAVADDAFQKYEKMDPTYKLLKENGLQTLAGEMYGTSFNQGVSSYNAKNWDSSAYYFKFAVKYSDIIFQNKWGRDTTMTIDSTSVLYTGIAFEKSNKKDEAAVYYGRIADAKIAKLGGNEMTDIYKWLADYYDQKKDYAKSVHYLELGRAVFPKDLYWPDMELELARKTGNKDTLFAKYEEVIKEVPDNHLFYYNYGLELYQYATDTSSGSRPANSADLVKKAQDLLGKSLQIKPDYPQAALVLGQISYNAGVDLQQQVKTIKGTKPEDVKKRADLRVAAGKQFDQAIPNLEKVDQDLGSKAKLKMEEKTTLKDAYDLLITIYEQKNTKDKVDAYTTKFNNVDKDH